MQYLPVNIFLRTDTDIAHNMEGNCMTGCKHCISQDIYEKHELKDENGKVWGKINEFVGYKHLCNNGHQEVYDEWHERNKDNTYEVFKKDYLPCFEPDNITEALEGMIQTAQKILDRLDEKEKEKNNP